MFFYSSFSWMEFLSSKPRIVVENGKMLADKKYRGKIDKVIVQYVKDLENALLHAKKDRVFITHSGCDDEVVNIVKKYLKDLHHFKNIYVTNAGGVISSHCGREHGSFVYCRRREAWSI